MPRTRPCFFAALARLGNSFQLAISIARFICAVKSPES